MKPDKGNDVILDRRIYNAIEEIISDSVRIRWNTIDKVLAKQLFK